MAKTDDPNYMRDYLKDYYIRILAPKRKLARLKAKARKLAHAPAELAQVTKKIAALRKIVQKGKP